MKRIFLIMLITMIGILLADGAFPLLSLEEVSRDYLSDYEIVKTVNLEGSGHNCAIAKESGDMVVMTETEESYLLHYINTEGNIQWINKYEKPNNGFYIYVIYISDNGKTITLIRNFDEDRITYILNNKGSILFSKFGDYLFLPSPNGQYISQIPYYCDSNIQNGVILTNTGEEIAYELPEDIHAKCVCTKFLDNNSFFAIVSYGDYNVKNKRIIWYEINELKQEIINQQDIEFAFLEMSFPYFVKSNREILTIRSTNPPGLYIFDYKGNLLTVYEDNFSSYDITDNSNIIIDHVLPSDLRILDIDSNTQNIYDINLRPNHTANFITESILKDNCIVMSLFRSPNDIRTERYAYQSMIYDLKKDITYTAASYFMRVQDNSDDFIISIQQYSNPSVYILKGVEK